MDTSAVVDTDDKGGKATCKDAEEVKGMSTYK